MAEWWQMKPGEIAVDRKALEERHLAYFNTFMTEGDGMNVYCDIENEIDEEIHNKPADMTASEHAIGCRYLICFLNVIRFKCGIVDKMKFVRALASAAAEYRVPAEKTKDEEDIYEGV